MGTTMTQEDIISISSVSKKFPVGRGEFTALKDINLQIKSGDFMGLVGPSGSGKTTLLNLIGALDTPSTGQLQVLNQQIDRFTHQQASAFRKHTIGFIFQTYNLLPIYTVYENVEFPLMIAKVPPAERHQAVMQSLEWVGLSDKKDSRPAQLSGGESQRVAVARAMVKKPKIVLADEPTANLDADNSHNILKTMRELNQTLGTTFIFSTHDQKVIDYLGRVVSLQDGRIASDELKQPTQLGE